jgi:hypothetical protein
MQLKQLIVLGMGLLIGTTSFALSEQTCLQVFNDTPPTADLNYFVSRLGQGEVIEQGNVYLWRRGEFTLSIGTIGTTRGVKIYPEAAKAPQDLVEAVQMKARGATIADIEGVLGAASEQFDLRQFRWVCEDDNQDSFEHYALVDQNDKVFTHFSFVMPVD